MHTRLLAPLLAALIAAPALADSDRWLDWPVGTKVVLLSKQTVDGTPALDQHTTWVLKSKAAPKYTLTLSLLAVREGAKPNSSDIPYDEDDDEKKTKKTKLREESLTIQGKEHPCVVWKIERPRGTPVTVWLRKSDELRLKSDSGSQVQRVVAFDVEVKAAGRTFKANRIEIEGTQGKTKITGHRMLSAQVPGGIVKEAYLIVHGSGRRQQVETELIELTKGKP